MVENPNLIEEYKVLRDENEHNSQITATVFLANSSATAILFGYGFSTESGTIFLSPLAILIPSLFFITSKLESTTRIASYIRVFIEPELGLKWQKRWLQLREKDLIPHKRKYTVSLAGLYGALNISCLILALIYWSHPIWTYFAVIIPLGILILVGIRSLVNAFSPDFRQKYDESWKKLKEITEEGSSYEN